MATTTRKPALGRPSEWGQERIEEELLLFAAGSGRMPTQLELRACGRADLAAALTRYGGAAYWARRLGLTLTGRQVRYRASEEQLLAEARAVIACHSYLPGENKLRQLDHIALAIAVKRAGGSQAFCVRHGLPWLDGRTSAVRRRRVLPKGLTDADARRILGR